MKLPALSRLLGCFLIAGTMLLGSGCVYFRLLQLKFQLEHFDDNFIATTKEGVTIACLHPVLISDDLRFLGIDPKSTRVKGEITQWHVRWLKDEPPRSDEKVLHDVELFIDLKDDKLQSLHIPERYFEFFPKELFIDLLRSTGQASIDKFSRKAEVRAGQETSQTLATLPSLNSVENFLGVPTERTQEGTTVRYRYRYRTETPTGRGKAIEMTFSFDTITGDLKKLVGKLPKGTMSYDFAAQSAKKEKTSASVSSSDRDAQSPASAPLSR